MADRINQGYLVTSSVHVGESEFVLGVNVKAPSQFVTWKCSDGNNYYWSLFQRPVRCGKRPCCPCAGGNRVSGTIPQAGRTVEASSHKKGKGA